MLLNSQILVSTSIISILLLIISTISIVIAFLASTINHKLGLWIGSFGTTLAILGAILITY